jgi:rubredoxin
MPRKGPESSSRKLVWVEGQSFEGWGCSECAWVFNPSGPPTGKSLDEMKLNFQAQLSEEFMSPLLRPSPSGQRGEAHF